MFKKIFIPIPFILFFMASHLHGFQIELVKKYLPQNPVILDCGANSGRMSLFWKKIFPASLILSVEADPELALRLFENVQHVQGVIPFHCALSDREGSIEFYQNLPGQGDAQGSLFKQSRTNWYWDSLNLSEEPILVPSKTLDGFCQEIGVPCIDFLFLDMQGGEMRMLSASSEILPQAKVICTEVSFESIYEGIPLYGEVKSFLESKGFVEVHLSVEHPSWGDAYFVNQAKYKCQ